MPNFNKLSEAVYIGTTEKECEIGVSKFWGAPHITEDFDWPVDADGYDMDFICQIRTDDVDSEKKVFKKSGILYFFGCLTAPLGFADEPCIGSGIQPDGYFAVRFSDADNSDLQFGEIVDEDGNEVGFSELQMEFSHDENAFNSALHQVFGDAPETESEDGVADGYSLLLCIDSFAGRDFTLEFEDSGYLYFLIDKKDVENMNFDNVKAYAAV